MVFSLIMEQHDVYERVPQILESVNFGKHIYSKWERNKKSIISTCHKEVKWPTAGHCLTCRRVTNWLWIQQLVLWCCWTEKPLMLLNAEPDWNACKQSGLKQQSPTFHQTAFPKCVSFFGDLVSVSWKSVILPGFGQTDPKMTFSWVFFCQEYV